MELAPKHGTSFGFVSQGSLICLCLTSKRWVLNGAYQSMAPVECNVSRAKPAAEDVLIGSMPTTHARKVYMTVREGFPVL